MNQEFADNTKSNLAPSDAMPPPSFAKKIIAALGIFAAFFILAVVLWQGAEVFLLVFAGLLLAIFLSSLSDFLSRHTPLSSNWSLIVVLLTIIGIAALGVWLLSDSMQTQFDDLSNELPSAFERARQQISHYPLGRRVVGQIPSPQEIVRQPSNDIFGRVTGFFSQAFSVAVNVLVVLIIGVYLAFNPRLYAAGVVKLVPQSKERRAREILSTMEYTLRRFLLGAVGVMTINGTLTALGLLLLGIPFAIPLAVITALLNFIPNIGPLIAAVPAILIAFSQSPTTALYVALLYLAVQNIDGFVTTPLIQQRAVALPPVLVIAAQLLLAVLFGFLGLLLAVPIVAVVFVAVKMIYVEDILGKHVEVKGEQDAKNEISLEALSSE
jgi:predicted PurR-regulated permease PerM